MLRLGEACQAKARYPQSLTLEAGDNRSFEAHISGHVIFCLDRKRLRGIRGFSAQRLPLEEWGARLVLMRNAEQGEWVAGRMGVCVGG